jgi:hypothetical protein
MGKHVVHFEVIGKDARKLQDFYGKLFDWKIDANNPMNYGIIDANDAGIGGGVASGQGSQDHVTFYVEVDDLQATLDKAGGMGGRTVQPPMDVPGGPTIAMMADPEGHLIGLLKAGSMS